MADAPQVLLMFTHNAGWPQVAAVLLDHAAADRDPVTSAASLPASQLNPAVVRTMGRHSDLGHQMIML
jgi:arsenate reductase (thioredoxin)